MIRVEQGLEAYKNIKLKIMAIGNSGSGKTHFASTFPKCYFLITEPGGQDTFLTNPNLSKNIVGYDVFIPSSADDTKTVFMNLHKAILDAKEMAKKGEIETLVLDNMSFLSENRWIYQNKYAQQLTKQGELNTLAMYGDLARWMYQFTLMQLLTFPGNVVVTCHEQMENEETLAKKADKSSPILPNILGGFRDKAEGLFSCVLYLTKLKNIQNKQYEYWARTNKGQQKNAKSRYPLPETLTNISYGTIIKAIEASIQKKGGESTVKEK